MSKSKLSKAKWFLIAVLVLTAVSSVSYLSFAKESPFNKDVSFSIVSNSIESNGKIVIDMGEKDDIGKGYGLGAKYISENIITKAKTEDTLGDSVKWKSENSMVAEVNETGWITPVDEGVTRVIAEYKGFTDIVEVEVRKQTLEKIYFNRTEFLENRPIRIIKSTHDKESMSPLILALNAKYTNGYEAEISGSNDVKWMSSDEKVATVSTGGNIVTVGEGTATITAKYKGKEVSETIEVVEKELVDLEISKNEVVLETISNSEEVDIIAKFSDGEIEYVNEAADWKSSDPKVATGFDGRINALGKGEAIITYSFGGLSKNVKVTVLSSEKAEGSEDIDKQLDEYIELKQQEKQ